MVGIAQAASEAKQHAIDAKKQVVERIYSTPHGNHNCRSMGLQFIFDISEYCTRLRSDYLVRLLKMCTGRPAEQRREALGNQATIIAE